MGPGLPRTARHSAKESPVVVVVVVNVVVEPFSWFSVRKLRNRDRNRESCRERESFLFLVFVITVRSVCVELWVVRYAEHSFCLL